MWGVIMSYNQTMQVQEPWRRLLLRTDKTAKLYEQPQNANTQPGCRLCSEAALIREFKHWILMPNSFPYDRYFSKSDMLITARHTDGYDLTMAELEELRQIKAHELQEYDLIFENLPKQKSIPHHLHFHLVEIKKPV